MNDIVKAIIYLIIATLITFFILAGLTYLICLGFGLTFTWIKVLGIWAIYIILNTLVGPASRGN